MSITINQSEMRYDTLKQKWTVIAPERAVRPSDFITHRKELLSDDKTKFCPFCPGNEKSTTKELLRLNGDENGDWSLRVVANKYPAFRIEGNLKREGYGVYDKVTGIGAHEVIVETPAHELSLTDYSIKTLYNLFYAFKERMLDLKRDIRFRYIFAFKNYGHKAGATLVHPHSQIIAMPVIPDTVVSMLRSSREYYEKKERCIVCDILDMEFRSGNRIVFENADFVALCPYASFFSFETRIYPTKHSHDFTLINDDGLLSLAGIVKETLVRLDKSLVGPHLNIVLHTSPPTNERPSHPDYWKSIAYDYHWHLEIIPRISGYAGFEWATGFNINIVRPEESAKFLRDVSV
jgi:UDPglucose--hexose-1-phosphate uridylyltransferase